MATQDTWVHSAGRDKYPGYWAIKKLRRGLRGQINRLLAARQTTGTEELLPIEPAQLRRVLVCRRNNRLGNLLLLTPLLQSLASRLPHAEIDVLIGDAHYAPLLQGLPGIRRVWTMPARGWLWPVRLFSLLIQLRRRHYDLSIDPALNSFSNRLSSRLSAARWRLGFHGKDQWLALTHAIPSPRECHEALKPLTLVSAGIAGNSTLSKNLSLALRETERTEARHRLQSVLGKNDGRPILGFLTEATGRKRLDMDWWREWLACLRRSRQDFQLVQILPPGQKTPLEPGMATVCETDYRKLAAILGQLDLFVACDSGPMHLAAAVGTATVGLFQATDSRRYRPLASTSIALEPDQLDASGVAQQCLRHLLAGAVRDEPLHRLGRSQAKAKNQKVGQGQFVRGSLLVRKTTRLTLTH